ncbi:flagellar type III secretion system protein FlhB [Defluviimonas sp. WL0024]|uniref:Flagellar type III secretion system protein FlhB n=1 Tax=Albidovulum salinarum TaxID=2984153 RepID=A0ABT2X6U9_9RHOB|nr:flagellar type III secretion system protein FlhB [Defluviimonas sp. WL0024]MCU9849469.1 flagellar type III secretion system protein FlhB [Defluviimonas sp. WL0024]
MSEEDGGEKEHEPSQKKLDEARARGELVRSTGLAIAASYGGFFLACAAIGSTALRRFGDWGVSVLDQADTLGTRLLVSGGELAGDMVLASALPALPFLIAPMVAVAAIIFAQRGWVFAPEKLMPRLSRINPLGNARQKFGRTGLFEFAKSTAKLVIIAALLTVFLIDRLPRMLTSQSLDPGLAVAELVRLIVEFLFLLVLVAGGLGALDYLWQRHEHLRRNRMSRQELIDELRQSEGDPQMRGLRRQRAEAIATNRMLADVPKADVVIVNPTHFAVALHWDRASGRAPMCVAKGVDAVAARIREAAATAGVPIRSDPSTARALHAGVEIGREVRPEHYAAVAAAIRFAENMRQRARARRGG